MYECFLQPKTNLIDFDVGHATTKLIILYLFETGEVLFVYITWCRSSLLLHLIA